MAELLEPRGSATPAPTPVMAEESSSAGVASDWRITARSLGRIGLAILLYSLLADAALERILSGSAVRWLVTGTVAAYATATVLLWRRFEWRAKNTASYLVLLVLFLLSTLTDRGLRDGIRLLGQSTAVVLAAGSALAVLCSAAILVRPIVPRAARGVIAAVALYGVAAFVAGAGAAVGFPNLFHGQSLWGRLPFWLQGPFVGSLVLVPVATVYQVATGVRLRGELLRLHGLQVAGLATAAALAVAALWTPVGLGFGPTETRLSGGVVRLSPITFARGESGSQPVGPVDRLPQGLRALYAFVDFEGLTSDDTVGAVWYKGADRVTEQRFKMGDLYGAVVPKKGRLRLLLQLDQGALPGAYFLEISIDDVLAQAGILRIDPPRGQTIEDPDSRTALAFVPGAAATPYARGTR